MNTTIRTFTTVTLDEAFESFIAQHGGESTILADWKRTIPTDSMEKSEWTKDLSLESLNLSELKEEFKAIMGELMDEVEFDGGFTLYELFDIGENEVVKELTVHVRISVVRIGDYETKLRLYKKGSLENNPARTTTMKTTTRYYYMPLATEAVYGLSDSQVEDLIDGMGSGNLICRNGDIYGGAYDNDIEAAAYFKYWIVERLAAAKRARLW